MNKLSQLVLTILIICFFCSTTSYAKDLEKDMIIILANRIDLEDIEKMPFTKSIINTHGNIGLMNTKAYGHNNEFSSAATIGSGTRNDATYYTSRSFNLNDEKANIYKRRTGYNIGESKIANIDIASFLNLNKKNNYNPYIGALGTKLKDLGLNTGVIGNSDTDERSIRLGVLIGMDKYGLIENGGVESPCITKDINYPFGMKSNYDYILNKYMDVMDKSNLIIVELGDIYRLERYKTHMTDEVYSKKRNRIINDIDIFIKKIYEKSYKDNVEFIILNPYPSNRAIKAGKKLTPVILFSDELSPGILTSSTTRRHGIIANIDIAPYVSNYFGGTSEGFTGKPIEALNKDGNFRYIKKLNNKTAYIYRNRFKVLYTFAISQIVVSIIAFFLIQFSNKLPNVFKNITQYLLLTTMTIPFSLLILPAINKDNIVFDFIVIIVLSLSLSGISLIINKKPLDSIIFLSGITCIGLSIDILKGSQLIKLSYLGYDPVIGARYYGIGNEFMGILISSSIVFITAVLDRFKINKAFAMLCFGCIIVIIGYPRLGANVGGTITATFAFMYVAMRLYRDKLRIKDLIFIIGSIFVVIAFIAFIDLNLIKNNTHLANSLRQIGDNGLLVVYSIIHRKILMNIKLFSVTIWSKVLITTIIFLAILFYRPFGTCKKIFNKYSNFSKGLMGILVACIVGFLVNDSGVIAAATSIIFLGMSLMYLIINDIKE